MMKILVFGCARGTEALASFLEQELPMEVERLICEEDFTGLSTREIVEKTDSMLEPFIGEAKIIVLADPLGAIVTKDYLQRKYPKQLFVGYGWEMARLIKGMRTVCILVSRKVRITEEYQKMKAECQDTDIEEPDCEQFIKLVKEGWETRAELNEELKPIRGKSILVWHSELPFKRMEEIIDYRGDVTDIGREILADIKRKIGCERWI